MTRLLLLFAVILTSAVQAAETADDVDVLLFHNMNRSTCEVWRTRFIEMGYRPSMFGGIAPESCDTVNPEGVVIAVRAGDEVPKTQTEAQPRFLMVSRSRAPDKIESAEDVINLIANFDDVTTKAIRTFVPADSNGNGATLKIHRFTVSRGPEGVGGTASYMGLLFQAPLK